MLNKEFLKNTTILYVEDDSTIREEFTSIISKILKKVIIAKDGLDGFEKYIEHQDEIDLVISDINMPHMSGVELLTKIKEKNNNLPFIFTTAYTDSEYLINAIQHKVSDYFIKPADISELLARIEEICKTKEKTNKVQQIESKTHEYLDIINQVAIVYIFDDQGKLVYVNEFLEELTKCTREELVENNFKSIYHPDMAKNIIDLQWEELQKDKIWKGKIKYIAKDSSVFYTNATILPSDYNGVRKFISINFLTTKEENERREYKKKVLYNLQETKKIFRVAQEKINVLTKTLEHFTGYEKKAIKLQDLKVKNNENFKKIQDDEQIIKNIKTKLDQLTYGVNSKIQKVAIATSEMKDVEEKSSKKIDKTIQEIKIREQFIQKITEEIDEKSTTIEDLKDVLEHRNEQLEG